VITGGSRGIGAQIAEWMAEAGADVALCGRDGDAAARTAARLSDSHGGRVMGDSCDVGQPDSVAEWVQDIDERLGRIDIAVANAAVFGPVGPLDAVDLSAWLETVAVDVGGVASLAHSVLPVMHRNGFGRLVALSGGGVGGPRPLARASAYVTSKAAVCALVEVLALELAETDVTVNAIAPGAVPTGFMRGALDAGPDLAGDELFAAARDSTPADLDGLRSLFSYLVSDESSWVNGRVLSARWDSVRTLERDRSLIEAGSRLRLRRVDGDLYGELKGDSS